MAPQVVQYPRATSLTAHSSRAVGVEVAGGSGGINPIGNVQPDRQDSTRSEGVDSSRSGVRLTATSTFVNAGAKKPLATPTGGGEAWPDNQPTRRATHQRPGAAGVEGAGGTGGHGRASRSTTPSRQARVWRSRGRPGPTAPGTPAEPQATSSIANSGCTAGVKGARGPGCGRAWLRCPWAVAGPGRASRRRAERSSRRGRRAGGPPPTGAQSSPARRVRPDGARNTSGATSTVQKVRTPRSTPGSGRPGGRRGGRAH